MKSFSIKTKFTIIAVSVAFSIALISFINIWSSKTIQSLEKSSTLVDKIEIGMLTLRRNEKDFLARNDVKYHGKFTKNHSALQENVHHLQNQLESDGIDSSEVLKLNAILENYKNKFNALVTEQKKIGVNPKDGLYGSLRDAVHNAEKEIKSLHDANLMKDMLMLRRREKDFMLRNDLKYLDKFNKDFTSIESTLANSLHAPDSKASINKYLKQYKIDFVALVNGYQVKGLTSKTGLLGEMRDTVHKTEAILKTLEEKLKTIIDTKETSITLFSSINVLTLLSSSSNSFFVWNIFIGHVKVLTLIMIQSPSK